MYHNRINGALVIVAVTFDDFCVALETAEAYKKAQPDFRLKYRAKDLGRAKRLLSWSLRQTKEGGVQISQLYLSQRLSDLLSATPARTNSTLYLHGLYACPRAAAEPIVTEYQSTMASAVGMLRYLVDSTRPYLAYVTAALALSVQQPTYLHWRALRQVAKYVANTLHFVLHYKRGALKLRAARNSDFASCATKRRSTIVNLLWLGLNLVSWLSRRIKTVVTST